LINLGFGTLSRSGFLRNAEDQMARNIGSSDQLQAWVAANGDMLSGNEPVPEMLLPV